MAVLSVHVLFTSVMCCSCRNFSASFRLVVEARTKVDDVNSVTVEPSQLYMFVCVCVRASSLRPVGSDAQELEPASQL